MMPSLFLAHGSPMLAIQDTPYTRFLEEYAQPLRPDAIVVFTAHWESEVLAITDTDDVYETIYDFGGFPDELYAIQYNARGSRKLASRLAERFRQAGIESRLDAQRGLDHGTWTLLHRMFPQADIPVVQLSVHPYLPPAEQYRIGEALRGLGEENILVIGSGVTVHNLRLVNWQARETEPWAAAFDDWLIGKTAERDLPSLYRYEELAPYAKQAVPRPEHFVPFFLAMGSGRPEQPGEVLFRGYELGTLSYLCFRF
ncbi:dioxygenase [Paenibacillus sp. J31TS4]|uniref:DODA-type extradiol aromatic ring-opening family dioxygenase n=1 Tax=Paenibacillus sp. J31TS4 TaxID=2807195 RepID=UPI001B2701F1|nr:class III extradiol ring-cleavage dioxygenase [Paenibacillus sp. J31TS4]GIP39485.1 dioxygenase [Paenibacillus sp. J31TS4]